MKLRAERVSSSLQELKTKTTCKVALEESSTLGTDCSEMKIVANCSHCRMVTHPLPLVIFKNMACTAALVNSKQSWLPGRKNTPAFISQRQISDTATAKREAHQYFRT